MLSFLPLFILSSVLMAGNSSLMKPGRKQNSIYIIQLVFQEKLCLFVSGVPSHSSMWKLGHFWDILIRRLKNFMGIWKLLREATRKVYCSRNNFPCWGWDRKSVKSKVRQTRPSHMRVTFVFSRRCLEPTLKPVAHELMSLLRSRKINPTSALRSLNCYKLSKYVNNLHFQNRLPEKYYIWQANDHWLAWCYYFLLLTFLLLFLLKGLRRSSCVPVNEWLRN